VAVWKLSTESLWIATGAPIWEFVERAGSYAAPLAFAALVAHCHLSQAKDDKLNNLCHPERSEGSAFTTPKADPSSLRSSG
jgi:hypothetical protein